MQSVCKQYAFAKEIKQNVTIICSFYAKVCVFSLFSCNFAADIIHLL